MTDANGSYENNGYEKEDNTELKHRFKDPSGKSLTEISLEDENSEDTTEDVKSKYQLFIERHKVSIRRLFLISLNLIIVAYFAYATYYHIDKQTECGMMWCDGYGMLILVLAIPYLCILYFKFLKPFCLKYFGKQLELSYSRAAALTEKKIIRIVLGIIALVAFLAFLIVDTADSRFRLRSLAAIVLLFGLCFLISKHPRKIKWRPVVLGFITQFLLGIVCIRWTVGRSIFECLGDRVKTFLFYSYEGAAFVYSSYLVNTLQVFAFSVLPVIYFFSFFISILYYLGAMQWFVMKLGWILQSILGTTVCESVTASANIFLGMSESPLLIRPYIAKLTHSEIHAIMTSGFATVSGTVLAAYIRFGAEPSHLITASVMAAPAALCVSKLIYPETEESLTSTDNIEMEKSKDSSILDAASSGASQATDLVLNIIANLIAFVSFIALVNGVLGWLGMLVGADNFDLFWIFRKIFMPLAYLLGVPWSESGYVGEIIATKTVINEFVAYEKLGVFKNESLIGPRSSAIATFAVCGFANPSSMGIMIGALSAMAPLKRKAITSTAFRAFIAGSFVCFLTASIASLLMTDEIFNSMTNTKQV